MNGQIFRNSLINQYFNQYLSRGIQFSRASLNAALTQHKSTNKQDSETETDTSSRYKELNSAKWTLTKSKLKEIFW